MIPECSTVILVAADQPFAYVVLPYLLTPDVLAINFSRWESVITLLKAVRLTGFDEIKRQTLKSYVKPSFFPPSWAPLFQNSRHILPRHISDPS